MILNAKINGQQGKIEIDMRQIVKYATVAAVNGNKVNLIFDGESAASTLNYVSTCACAVGNKVICLSDGFTYIVMGVTK